MIPHFWRKDDILQVLHQSKNVYTQLLCRLLDNHKRLVMEMKFLPIIVEFCSNLKSLLDFKVDGTTAKQLDMKAAIERACDEVKSSDKRGKILQLLRDFIGMHPVYMLYTTEVTLFPKILFKSIPQPLLRRNMPI